MKVPLRFTVNGILRELMVEPYRTLVDVLRDDLELTGAKKGCDSGHCGACTVLMQGKAVNSCLILALDARDKEILTIEGLTQGGTLHPLQEAFLQQGAFQCGYCTPGTILAAEAFLDENPKPTEAEIREGLAGNLCRCTGYDRTVKAVLSCAKRG
jgi:aerobic carbon-monoxide dehydrogenase small subunit